MPSAQPANTAISVFRRARVVRDNRRHTSIKHLTTPFDTAYVAVPGEEIQVLETRDGAFRTDAFRYGHPVVVLPRTVCTVANVYAAVGGLDFPVRMIGNPREVQLQNAHGHQTDDLYTELRLACPGEATLTADTWLVGTTYAKGAQVELGGKLWVSLVDGNHGVTPGTNGAVWQFIQ